ncbi:MAG: preprotein translocase subunit SecG [Candidatus Vogelbacteria bacterium]|nr:preprotein translocase subunit SecG [Candidatus Vogelbacteria bacterium]
MELLRLLLPWAQVTVSVLLVAAILFQQSEAGLGSAFGSSQGGGITHTKRGSEKILFYSTISLAIIFVVLALISLFI